MNKVSKFKNLKYYKPGGSYNKFKALERISFDPFRMNLLYWVDDAEVKCGIHQDKNSPSPTTWVAWVVMGKETYDTRLFNSKSDAHDWVISKGLRYLRTKKIKNQLALYGFLAFIILSLIFSLFMLIKVFPVL